MWVPSKGDVLPHLNWKRRILALGDNCDVYRELRERMRFHVAAVECDTSRRNIGASNQCTHDRAFPRAVRTRQRGEHAARSVEAYAVDGIGRGCRVPDDHVGKADHADFLSWTRKNGTPSNAVIAPSGSSAGAATVRAAKSAATTSVAPMSPAAIIRGR